MHPRLPEQKITVNIAKYKAFADKRWQEKIKCHVKETAVFDAIKSQDLKGIKKFLDLIAKENSEPFTGSPSLTAINENCCTFLLAAINTENREIIDFFLAYYLENKNPDFLAYFMVYNLVLRRAIQLSYRDIVNRILNVYAKIEASEDYSYKKFLSSPTELCDRILFESIGYKREEIAIDLFYRILNDPETRDILYDEHYSGGSLLHVAAKAGLSNLLEEMLSRNIFLVEGINNRNMTALHLACEAGFGKAAEVLIAYGATLDEKAFELIPENKIEEFINHLNESGGLIGKTIPKEFSDKLINKNFKKSLYCIGAVFDCAPPLTAIVYDKCANSYVASQGNIDRALQHAESMLARDSLSILQREQIKQFKRSLYVAHREKGLFDLVFDKILELNLSKQALNVLPVELKEKLNAARNKYSVSDVPHLLIELNMTRKKIIELGHKLTAVENIIMNGELNARNGMRNLAYTGHGIGGLILFGLVTDVIIECNKYSRIKLVDAMLWLIILGIGCTILFHSILVHTRLNSNQAELPISLLSEPDKQAYLDLLHELTILKVALEKETGGAELAVLLENRLTIYDNFQQLFTNCLANLATIENILHQGILRQYIPMRKHLTLFQPKETRVDMPADMEAIDLPANKFQ